MSLQPVTYVSSSTKFVAYVYHRACIAGWPAMYALGPLESCSPSSDFIYLWPDKLPTSKDYIPSGLIVITYLLVCVLWH